MTKWSEQQKQRAHEKKQLERKNKHEYQVELLKIMQQDPEMKYFIGMATGSLAATLGFMTGSTTDGGKVAEAVSTANISFAWLIPGVGTLEAFGITDLFGPDGSLTPSGGGMFDFIPNVLTLAGTGFAGMCASILILKAIFGDEDVASLLTGVGTVADAAIPL